MPHDINTHNVTIYRPGEMTPLQQAYGPGLGVIIMDTIRNMLSPSPDKVIAYKEKHVRSLELDGEIVQAKAALAYAEDIGRAKALRELDEWRRSLPSNEDLRRIEEIKQAEHETKLAKLRAEAAQYGVDLDEKIKDAEAERARRAPPPQKSPDQALIKLTEIALKIFPLEAEIAQGSQIAARKVQNLHSEFERECNKAGLKAENVFFAIRTTLAKAA